MAKLKVVLCDPAVRKLERGPNTWFLSGALPRDWERLRDQGDCSGNLEREICESRGDASIVKVTREGGRARQLCLWRGLSSAFLLFTTATEAGDYVVTDSFRAMLSCLPPQQRSPSEHVVVDHFLFGNVWGENTYSERVRRIPHGYQLAIDLKESSEEGRFFDRVDPSEPESSTATHLDAIDRTLSEFAGAHVAPGESVVLFSGGIDSTLLGCYMGRDLPYLNMRTQANGLNARLEQQYCADAAKLLGVRCETLFEAPEDYPDQLVGCIGSLGAPPQTMHMIWFDDAFKRRSYRKYFVAERADALFGHGGRLARFASHFTAPLPFHVLRMATPVLPRSQRFKLHELLPTARRLREPPESIHGYAARTSMWTTPALLPKIFPQQMIEERIRARLEYALARLERPPRSMSAFHRHFEIAQWIDYFCEDTLALYRQCAHAHGKIALSPFLGRQMLRIAAAIPGDRRYIKNGQGKYLLKRLLKAKLPGYKVNKRKAFPAVPLSQQYPNGPLGHVWERYSLPDFIDVAVQKEIKSTSSLLSWQAIKYAMWDKEIRSAERLSPPSASMVLETDIA